MDMDGIQTIAVVGLSDKPSKPSYRVAQYLQNCGFRVIPVNPTVETVLNEKVYLDLLAVPAEIQIDLVDVFRNSEAVLPVVEQAIARGDVRIIWMQEGIINQDAADLAENSGLTVIMDKCLMVEHKKWPKI